MHRTLNICVKCLLHIQKIPLCSYYNPRVVVCITVSKGKHTEEVLAHENAVECSKRIAVAGLAFAMSNRDVSVLEQGNLD